MERGFTLVEIMVSALILTIMVVAIFMVFNTGYATYNMDMGLVDLQQQARQTMDIMIRELRETTEKSVSLSGDRITFDTLTEGDIQYYRDTANNRAIREYPTGTTKIIGNYITHLSFCCRHDNSCDSNCSASNLVEIRLTSGAAIRGRSLVFPVGSDSSHYLTERVRLRNE